MSAAEPILSPTAQARLRAFRREVEKALPGQVVEMLLFGSRARGDAGEDSDYDVAVFLEGVLDRSSVRAVLSDAAYPHVLEGWFIRAIGLPAGYLRRTDGHRSELADEIARDGIPINS